MKMRELASQRFELTGKHVRLEPLELCHISDLFGVSGDDRIWRFMPAPTPHSVEDTAVWVKGALQAAASGSQIPFVIRSTNANRLVGSTRYLDIQPDNNTLEIGWTWIAPDFQRGPINTEMKYLMLEHAFERFGVVRVALKTDGRNEQSQRAIERLGAHREGTLRRNRRMWDGYQRDTVYYSILDNEWSEVKRRLVKKMRSYG